MLLDILSFYTPFISIQESGIEPDKGPYCRLKNSYEFLKVRLYVLGDVETYFVRMISVALG
jgi:hypothetical protein